MGFNVYDLRFVLSAIDKLGLTGKSVCTLGRLNLSMTQRELTTALLEYGRKRIILPNRAIHFADDALEPLGFNLQSIDASDYEGAQFIHDLNIPVPEYLHDKFDLVLDGGTLEHVFNFPAALGSLMRMVKLGGHVMMRTPANNHCGHGFYQFSPELFFRVFSPENGFELLRLYVTGPKGVYHVVDPASVRSRVELLAPDVSFLMVHAKKLENKPMTTPQQSDYVADWSEHAEGQSGDGRIKGVLRRLLSEGQIARVSKVLNTLRQRRVIYNWKRNSRLSNRRFYRPVTDWSMRTTEAFRHTR